MRRSLLAAVVAGLLWACTDSAVRLVNGDFANQVDIRGTFCTSPPERSPHPVRILFAVDSSDSMVFNDPSNLHVDGINSVIDRFRPYDNVEFGIIRWGEEIVRELIDYAGGDPVLFTKDETLLGEALDRMRQLPTENPKRYLGGTDYVEAFSAVRDYIIQDLAENPSYSRTAQYYIEFMTDGMPQAGGADAETTRENIIAQIDDLHTTYGARVDVISIVEIATVTPEFFDLLPDMAHTGTGHYIQMATADALDDRLEQILSDDLLLIEYDLGKFTVSDQPRSLVVANINARILEIDGEIGVYADSDGDGIVDIVEQDNGTDPSDPDTDHDGLGDLFETRLLGEFDPLARVSPCLSDDQLADPDGDGLSDFIENRLGTNPEQGDTDGDGAPDGLEFREGTNVLTDDLRTDTDNDGISNGFELRQHTNPLLDEGALRSRFSYRPDPIGDPSKVFSGRRCYEFAVQDVTLVETLAAMDEGGTLLPRGVNRIEVWRLEWPVEQLGSQAQQGPDSTSVRGYTWVIYRPSEHYRDPAALELTIRGNSID